MLTKAQLSSLIKSKAVELSFSAVGISKVAEFTDDAQHFESWLHNKYNAKMHYLENNKDKRYNPQKLVENSKSIITVALNYFPKIIQNSNLPVISKYAYGRDYHKVLKNKLKLLANYINLELTPIEYRYFVDSAPVLEKKIAEQAGIGWIGKNSLLINKKLGSFFFIGELFVNIELEYDQPIKNYCGTCTKCIDACPTKAIISERIIDSNKCISYQTIENKENIDIKLSNTFENRIFGCDICQDVCPWNAKILPTTISDFSPKTDSLELNLTDWNNLTELEFNKLFTGTPLFRAKYSGLKRNATFLTKK